MSEQQPQTVIVINQSPIVGILALVFAILSVFLFTPFFLPVALILTIVAFIKKQILWAVLSLIVCAFAVYTSPTMWLMIAGFFK